MRYMMVVGGKAPGRGPLAGPFLPARSFAVERLRNEADLEKRARAIRNAGGQVIAIGPEDDKRYEQRAKLAVVQLTNGSWGIDRAKQYLMEYILSNCRDEYVLGMNRGQDRMTKSG